MFKALAATAVALVVTTGISEAKTQFRGAFTIVSKKGTCPDTDVGWTKFAKFTPSGLTGDNRSRLAVFNQDGAFSYDVKYRFNTNFKVARFFTLYNVGSLETSNRPQVRYVSQSPATLTTTTNFVNIVGQVKGYDFQPDCLVTFRFSGARRVSN